MRKKICESQLCRTKVCEEGREEVFQATEQIALKPVEKIVIKQVVPLKPIGEASNNASGRGLQRLSPSLATAAIDRGYRCIWA